MDAEFWHTRWREGRTAFHEPEGNALLARHIDVLSLEPGARVLLPLCGKTRDIAWLLARGHAVVGVELSRLAIDQLFAELGVAPEISSAGPLLHYAAGGLDVFVGDVFALSPKTLGPVAAVYDRAALVALPEPIRARYAAHLIEITGRAPQLLVAFEYDPARLQGPPFSVARAEIERLYGASFSVVSLDRRRVGLRGVAEVDETAWHLRLD
ncbi:MAG: thiopurine S-methyltransferase [Pseudomonadota bacterium]